MRSVEQKNKVLACSSSPKHPHSVKERQIQQADCLRLLSSLPSYKLQQILEGLRSETVALHDIKTVVPSPLSDREKQVVILVANSYSRADIAQALAISPNTASRHIANIYRKLGISSVAEATTFAISNGLVSLHSPGYTT